MSCLHCAAAVTTALSRRTTLSYRIVHCRACRRTCNERTGTPFNHLQVLTDIAVLVVLWRFLYTLSLRNVAAMVLTRGFTFTHETVREWEERLAPLLTARFRTAHDKLRDHLRPRTRFNDAVSLADQRRLFQER